MTMKPTLMDRMRYLYPNVTNYVVWHTKKDGSKFKDAYDGLDWQNTVVPKPSKEDLMKPTDKEVSDWMEQCSKTERLQCEVKRSIENLAVVAMYNEYKSKPGNEQKSMEDYVKSLINLQDSLK